MRFFGRSWNLPPLILCVSALLLVSCSETTPVRPTQLTLEGIQQEIIDAESLPTEAKQSQFIILSESLYEIGEIQAAINLLERINSTQLSDNDYIRYVLISSATAEVNQSIFRSYALLSATRLQTLWPMIPVEQQITLLQRQAKTLHLLGDYRRAVDLRVELESLLVDPLDITANHEDLWSLLNEQSLAELQIIAESSPDPVTRGWYQLAVISKSHEANLVNQQQAVNQWIAANPMHPASIEPPLDLQILTTLIEQRPRHIAFLLPLSGKLATAGNAIQQGFMSALYNQQDIEAPEIRFYDTQTKAIHPLYETAVENGADLVIGPLEKEKVAELMATSYLPVKVLALNSLPAPIEPLVTTAETTQTTPENLEPLKPANDAVFQFSLSLEDEAIQAAERARLEGHRYSMIIASNADWSQRAVNAFTQRWLELDGKIVVDSQLSKESSYSETIKRAMDIDDSQYRARQLKRLFGTQFIFEPRRRQDVDMIFLVARSSEGQQIKPTLAFHYAGDLPVYATSQIYSSDQAGGKNRDLNGIRFTTMPWILDDTIPEKQAIVSNIQFPASYERLYAMGVDTYLLHDRLQQLQQLSNTFIQGSTGKLQLNSQQQIVRTQPWAQIVNGEAQPLQILTENTETSE